MSINEQGVPAAGWLSISLRKVPSAASILAIGTMLAGGVWQAARIQDQVTSSGANITLLKAEHEALAKIVDTDGRRIDALSFRQSAGDDRATALTASITALAAEFHTFVHEQDVADRHFADGLSEIKAMIGQLRNDVSWMRATGAKGTPPEAPMPGER